MCFFPVTITLSPTSAGGRDRPKSVLASADATLTLSEGVSVASGALSVGGPDATFMAWGWCFLRTRLVCTLSAICCSNKQIYAGFGGQGGPLATEHCVLGREKKLGGVNQTATGEWRGGSKEG